MDKYVIVSDATLDLPAETIKEVDVNVIPMHFMLGGNEYMHYPDERNMKLEDFYAGLKNGLSASTSQITPAEYIEFFEPFLKDGYDIIYICLSSGLSGTHGASCVASAQLLEDYPDRRIECIDSVCACIGEGYLVYLAGLKRLAGAGFDEMVAYINDTKVKVCHWFMVEDMEQLKRGGRISALEATLGSALHIVPILGVDPLGKLCVKTKLRGSKKALSFLKARVAVDGIDTVNQTVIIGHGNCPERASELKEELIREGLIKDAIIAGVGPVIGSHTGTGMCAVVFLGNNYQNV